MSRTRLKQNLNNWLSPHKHGKTSVQTCKNTLTKTRKRRPHSLTQTFLNILWKPLNVEQLNILQRIWKLSENAVENITKFKKPSKYLKNVYVITTFILACNTTARTRETLAQISHSSLKHCPTTFKKPFTKPWKVIKHMYKTFNNSLEKLQQHIKKRLNDKSKILLSNL